MIVSDFEVPAVMVVGNPENENRTAGPGATTTEVDPRMVAAVVSWTLIDWLPAVFRTTDVKVWVPFSAGRNV